MKMLQYYNASFYTDMKYTVEKNLQTLYYVKQKFPTMPTLSAAKILIYLIQDGIYLHHRTARK